MFLMSMLACRARRHLYPDGLEFIVPAEGDDSAIRKLDGVTIGVRVARRRNEGSVASAELVAQEFRTVPGRDALGFAENLEDLGFRHPG